MTDLYDAVDWTQLRDKIGPKAGYRDGPISTWPAEAWTALGADACVNITVLANPAWECFDSETGNAGVGAVAEAVAHRLDIGLWSVGYTNRDNLGGLTQALAGKSIAWKDSSFWPTVGCYLWAAAPGTSPGTVPAWCPVRPVAVQDRWTEGYDTSTLYAGWPVGVPALPPPAPPAPPAPPPAPPAPPTGVVNVNLPVLGQGSKGPSVRSLQLLVGGIAADGDFGPITHQAVVNYQSAHGLAADGLVGTHTWGALLGAPQ